MEVAGGIVSVSIPFVGGMAIAAALGPGDILSNVSLGLASASLLFLLIQRHSRNILLPAAVLFMSTGAFCFSLDGLCPVQATATAIRPQDTGWIGTGWIEASIDKLKFRDTTTAPLLKALLCGNRGGLPGSTIQAFRASGAAHILALSGLHLGILYGMVSKGLSVLGNSTPARITRAVTSVGLSGIYTLMTGAGPSIVRAFLFITINETARLLPWRRKDSLSVLCLALILQLAIKPAVLLSVGFQLSYLAMLGIFTVYPVLENWYPESVSFDPVRKIWTSAALTISCQLFTAPVVWFHFHTFPEFFLLTNLIALPLTELLVSGAVMALILSSAGLCPEILEKAVDELAHGLIFCLETISAMD